MTEAAKIYRRKNGMWGSSCAGIADTGHPINEKDGRFTVYSVGANPHLLICDHAAREVAEKAIAEDWRAA